MTRIGLLSDSHGKLGPTRQAVAVLLEHDVDLIVHLGDLGKPEVVDELLCERPGRGMVQAHVVFGNVDYDRRSLAQYARNLGVQTHDPIGTLDLPDGLLMFLHGSDHHAMQQAIDRQPRYLCHGHLHQQVDRQHGPTRIISPGALARTDQRTVAVLDTTEDELWFYPVANRW